MINKDKWIGTLPNIKHRFNVQNNQLDYNKWTGTIPKKSTYSSIKKYSLTAVLFVIGLLFVSTVKNETRNLQKEISNLQTSIGVLKFNLDQALEFIKVIKPKKAYLTHISHMLGFHDEVQKILPKNVFLAYDGLEITI